MEKNAGSYSRVLEEIEKSLAEATPEDLEATIALLGDAERIDKAVSRMQSGIARYAESMTPSGSIEELRRAAFSEIPNTPAQRARIRLILVISLEPKIGESIHQTQETVLELDDAEVLAIYESLYSGGDISSI